MADPDTVLNQLAEQLRTQIDALTADLAVRQNRVTGNESGVCDIPTDERWPRQWDYSRGLYLTEPDSRPTARRIADQLRAAGWTLRIDTDTSTDLMFTAQLDGAVIFVNSGTTEGAMVVNGTTACVNADGTVDRTPVG